MPTRRETSLAYASIARRTVLNTYLIYLALRASCADVFQLRETLTRRKSSVVESIACGAGKEPHLAGNSCRRGRRGGLSRPDRGGSSSRSWMK